MRRALAIIVATAGVAATLTAIPLTSQAAAMTVGVEAGEAEAGGTVDVPITADAPDAVGAIELELTFDASVLSVAGVEKGALIADNSLLEFGTDVEGTVVIAIASLEEISGEGELAIVSFDVTGSDGDTTEIGFADARAWESENHLEVLLEASGATLVVAAGSSLPFALIAAIAAAVAAVLIVAGLMMRRRASR
jgi:hypothetical protein